MQNSLVYLWVLGEIEAKLAGVLLGPLGSRGDSGKIHWCTFGPFGPSGRLKAKFTGVPWGTGGPWEIEAKFTGVLLGP